MLQEMETWQDSSPSPEIEIDKNGLSQALIDAEALHEQHDIDKKIIAWFHLAKLLACDGERPIPDKRYGTSYFFEVMRCNIYQDMINNIPDNWDTDEVPTEWMRSVYRDFQEWSAQRDNRKNRLSDIRQINFEKRKAHIGVSSHGNES